MTEIEDKRKEIKKGCNRNSALVGVNCGQEYEENYEIYYCNRCESKLEGFNLGVEMARKEFLDKIDFYFHKCWISKRVPKLEELKQSLGENDSPVGNSKKESHLYTQDARKGKGEKTE